MPGANRQSAPACAYAFSLASVSFQIGAADQEALGPANQQHVRHRPVDRVSGRPAHAHTPYRRHTAAWPGRRSSLRSNSPATPVSTASARLVRNIPRFTPEAVWKSALTRSVRRRDISRNATNAISRVMPPSGRPLRPGETRTRRGQRLEAQRLKVASRSHVPRIGNQKHPLRCNSKKARRLSEMPVVVQA